MSSHRTVFTLSGLIACMMITGLGFYSVNANGAVERVVDGYGVIAE